MINDLERLMGKLNIGKLDFLANPELLREKIKELEDKENKKRAGWRGEDLFFLDKLKNKQGFSARASDVFPR